MAKMIKCDFCTKSSSNGECRWSLQSLREDDCREAIKAMTEALKNIGVNNLKDNNFKR